MDGLRADDQGAHIQHAIESRNDVENWAPDGEGKIEPQELGHKAQCMINIIYVVAVWEGTGNGNMDKGLKGNRAYLVVCFQDGGDAHDGR